MSAAASERVVKAESMHADEAPAGAPRAPDEPEEGPLPLIEDASDRHETLMAYDPTARFPILVTLVWVCALAGLGAYLAAFYFPDLALWRAP